MSRFPTFLVSLLSSLTVWALVSPPVFAAESDFAPRSIQAAGTASATAAADRARLVVGVSTQAATAKGAVEATAGKMQKVVATLKALVANRGTVESSSYEVVPQYTYSEGRSRERELSGYAATNTVVAETADLNSLGAIIDAVTADGANEIRGVTFFLVDDSDVRHRALLAAGKVARAEAEAVAESLQVDLGPLLHASSVASGGPEPYRMLRTAAFSEAAPRTEILPGDVEVSATVHVTFGIR